MKLWSKSHPKSGPWDCPSGGWRVTPGSSCTRWMGLWVTLLEEHQTYNKTSRLECGSGKRIFISSSAQGFAPGLTLEEGTCWSTHLSCSFSKKQGTRDENGVEPSVQYVDAEDPYWGSGSVPAFCAKTKGSPSQETGTKALIGQQSTNRSLVLWTQNTLLSGSLSTGWEAFPPPGSCTTEQDSISPFLLIPGPFHLAVTMLLKPDLRPDSKFSKLDFCKFLNVGLSSDSWWLLWWVLQHLEHTKAQR